MDEHGLVVDSEDAVRGHRNPIVALESQRLAGHQHNVRAAVSALHLVLAAADLRLAVRRLGAWLFRPAGSRAEEQARRVVCPAANIARAHDALAVRNSEVKQAPHIALRASFLWDLSDEAIDPLDRLEHSLTQHRVSESVSLLHLIVRVCTKPLQAVEEERKRPLTVGAASHALEPAIAHARHQPPLDAHLPAADAAIVHPHERPARERVAVGVGEGAFGAGADVGEDQRADGLAGQTLEVAAVPGGDGRGEDARLRAQVYLVLLGGGGVFVGVVGLARGGGVVAHAEAVAIVGQEDGLVTTVDKETTHDCPAVGPLARGYR
ncbi:2928_t:CDS:2, partial [Scutellospora calospora]